MKFPQLVNFQEMTQVYSMPIQGNCQLYAGINGDICNVDLIDELEDFALAQAKHDIDNNTTAMYEFMDSWMHAHLELDTDNEK
jgi:hypothetical protein